MAELDPSLSLMRQHKEAMAGPHHPHQLETGRVTVGAPWCQEDTLMGKELRFTVLM